MLLWGAILGANYSAAAAVATYGVGGISVTYFAKRNMLLNKMVLLWGATLGGYSAAAATAMGAGVVPFTLLEDK